MTRETKDGLEMKDSQPGEENEAVKTENVEQTVTYEDKPGAGSSDEAVIEDVAESAVRKGKQDLLAKYPKGDWPYKAAGFWDKLIFSLLILVIAVLVAYFWSVKFTEVRRKINSDFSIEWSAVIEGFILNPGPPSFWYDRDLKVLHHRGPIDAEIKKELINLPTYPESEDSSFRDVVNSYRESINRLAFQSNEIDIHFAVSLILLAGLSGLIGSMLRIIGDFVGWACFLYQLDLARWWPFYLLRPVMGFIIGAATVIIFKGSMAAVFNTSGLMTSTVGIYSWIIFAFLAGFSVSDFTRMLKNLSKRIFGNE